MLAVVALRCRAFHHLFAWGRRGKTTNSLKIGAAGKHPRLPHRLPSAVLDTSLPVRNPDVLHLNCVLQVPPAFPLIVVEPIDRTSFIRKYLLEVADGKGLNLRGRAFVRETPDGIEVIVLGQHFRKLCGTASDDVYDASWQIAGVEQLIEVPRN